MPRALTTKQIRILEHVHSFATNRGYPPTLQELAHGLGLTASTVQGHVDRLIRKGALSRDGEGRRTLRITDKDFLRSKHPGLKLLGRIQAGRPLEPIENAEMVELADLLPLPKNVFVLEVQGDSMIEAGILDGDYVMIDPQRQAKNGNIVVAITPDGDATLKEVYFESGRVRLQPRNAAMAPISLPHCEIRGVMVGLVRRSSKG